MQIPENTMDPLKNTFTKMFSQKSCFWIILFIFVLEAYSIFCSSEKICRYFFKLVSLGKICSWIFPLNHEQMSKKLKFNN